MGGTDPNTGLPMTCAVLRDYLYRFHSAWLSLDNRNKNAEGKRFWPQNLLAMRLWTLSFLASLHLNFLISVSLKKRSYGSFSESSELNVYWTHLFPIRDRRAPSGNRWDCYTTATAKVAKRVWGLATSSTGQSLAMVPVGRCGLPGISSHLCSNQSSPGSQWGSPPSYAVTRLAFEGVRLGLWWAQRLQLKGTIHLFHSTGTSAGVGVHWAFPAIMAPYPTSQGTSEHLASCWVHPDGVLGNWGCNGWACGPFWALLVRAGSDSFVPWPSEVLTLTGDFGTPRIMSLSHPYCLVIWEHHRILWAGTAK